MRCLKPNKPNLIRSLIIGLNFITIHNTQFFHISPYIKTQQFTKMLFKSQANNVALRSWGQTRMEPKLRNHVELIKLTGIADTKTGK